MFFSGLKAALCGGQEQVSGFQMIDMQPKLQWIVS
jgi:hypothetical protein